MTVEAKIVNRRVVLKFPHRLIEEPIVCRLVRDYDLDVNILKAKITPREEGLLVLELTGAERAFDEGIAYMKNLGMDIQPLTQDIIRVDERSTHSGASVAVCPSPTLVLDPKTRNVLFQQEHCVACELCVPACPYQAMEVHY